MLNDTVTMKQQGVTVIESTYPWCLPVPDKVHAIEILSENKVQMANVTGINEMEIGNNFIVGS